jgi:hypothetical protein
VVSLRGPHTLYYIEIVHQDEAQSYVSVQSTPLITYTSGIGNCMHALPKHIQPLVGHFPPLNMPTRWDTTDPKDLILATDGSFIFGVGYHSWVITISDEEILLTGGGPDDRSLRDRLP